MSARSRFTGILRWGACFIIVLGAHAAGAMALLDWQTNVAPLASAPAILVDLAPAPVAPTTTKTELPPGPQQPQAEPEAEPTKPVEKVEVTRAPTKPAETRVDVKPHPAPEEVLTVMPPPRPVERRHHETRRPRLASLPRAPSAAEHRAQRAAALAPGAARDSAAVPNWKSRLLARLERYKRYPEEAQRRGEHGIAQLAFSVDRRGRVHHARILRSSGSALLDRATLALLQRAEPLPPPPPEISGARIPIVVPIRYHMR
jgi:periplasmic protein TonB